MDNEKLLEDMKPRMKEHPYLKKLLDDMVADGLSEDEALNVMINAWLCGR